MATKFYEWLSEDLQRKVAIVILLQDELDETQEIDADTDEKVVLRDKKISDLEYKLYDARLFLYRITGWRNRKMMWTLIWVLKYLWSYWFNKQDYKKIWFAFKIKGTNSKNLY